MSLEYELCNFGDSTYKLNAFIFAFKLALYNVKMNGKSHANYLHLIFTN